MDGQNNEKRKLGRRKGNDNKVAVVIYIRESNLIKLGKGFLLSGKDKARDIGENAVNNAAGFMEQ